MVLALAEALPGAPLYTSVYSAAGTFAGFADLDVRVAPLGRLVRSGAFRWYAPIYPVLFRSLDLSEYDTVVVSSSAFAHHVRHPRSFVYCHTPPRFLYERLPAVTEWFVWAAHARLLLRRLKEFTEEPRAE